MTDQPMWIHQLTPDEIAVLTSDVVAGGLLEGVTFAAKDNIDVAGVDSTAGFPGLANNPATASAFAVAQLLAAGAVPVGKTNMDQFATGLVGTRSPYGACHAVDSPLHISGGSSSGSGVAVASGQVALALGTDTAGSGRVPAAFNGIVGVKATKGLISTSGVLPACRSLDCVTTFTRTVGEARAAFEVLARYDPTDAWSRPMPESAPVGVARELRVIAVPAGDLDLDPLHREAWLTAVEHADDVADQVVEVDISVFLEAAQLLYGGPWVAERYAGFGHLLEDDVEGLDPVVRKVVLGGRDITGAAVFAALDRLAVLRRRADQLWTDVDALLLPVTPTHPTFADVEADPVGVNSRLGVYTNFVNLLDLCAVAVPSGRRSDGLPFGTQLIATAFADRPLLDLAARWCGEIFVAPQPAPATVQVAVVGAHLSGMALNHQLVSLGGTLVRRARTSAAYRLYRLPGAGVPRPGLVRTGDGPAKGLPVEVWEMPLQGYASLQTMVPAPLGFGRLELSGGDTVHGFVCESYGVAGAEDITSHGGWRRYMASL
ncbi:allophanate hydrolase [Acidothermaceae bacterium B102]|nr:allophanate hydrolase [Acidothermaceae bacterium B102]